MTQDLPAGSSLPAAVQGAAFWTRPLAFFERNRERLGRRREEEGDDVLAMLLAARHEDGSPMTDQEVRDELMTLLVAGHETTASTLAWAFAILPRHPEVLAALASEVDAGDSEDLLTATIQETLRLRPVLPNAAPRYVMKEIEVGGWTYEPGCCLVPIRTWSTTTPSCTPTHTRFGLSASSTSHPARTIKPGGGARAVLTARRRAPVAVA